MHRRYSPLRTILAIARRLLKFEWKCVSGYFWVTNDLKSRDRPTMGQRIVRSCLITECGALAIHGRQIKEEDQVCNDDQY